MTYNVTSGTGMLNSTQFNLVLNTLIVKIQLCVSVCGCTTACSRTKKQAKREAASQLLDQMSSATELSDSPSKDPELSATTSGHRLDNALASWSYLSANKTVLNNHYAHNTANVKFT